MATKRTTTAKSREDLLEERLDRLEAENARLRTGSPDNFNISLDEYIEVMSLFPGKLNLSTEKLGRGKTFQFSEFGEIKRILYNDLASIFEGYRTFMEQGLFYVLNERVIRKHGLNDIYEKILTKDMMLKVINCDAKNAVKLYENATKSQREVLDNMIITEIKNENPNMDFNIITKISKLADKDLTKLAEEAKEMEASTTVAKV